MNLFSKIFNAFKSIRLNDKNVVVGQQLDYLLVSSMYAEQQSAYLNSYETGLSKTTIKKLLEEYWSVFDKKTAIEILLDLQNRNEDKYINFVYDAFENKSNYVTILKSNLPAEDEIFRGYLDIYRNLNNVVPELIEENVIEDFAQIKKIKDAAWNYGRGAFVSRCCYEMGYLSESEMKEYLRKSFTDLKKYCSTWQEYTISYIFGRALWGGPNNSGMIQIADDLLHNEKSPLKSKKYL
ncbi:hypothetical protein FLA105534_01573 [Flavobacterium bizetiae]|uniref:DUF1266 domain-containing protein n=1 Tax=Flavobacterium bizetiae TaxID=2704140 RepID=A0A6J4GIG2_9FLAO|nr:DUF1266 domain-containing protein [Flavobacterium bizetiae]CAA9197318.1 hypothetical protein FLA105534_01573 [Flavobacterium bizetiae]CAD5342567.1 hypothetical protein FLA105535_02555 [Flavobacterium bizetiae]CAD5348102.1 hypothetical protein FLA105534_02061 [Flavobacterium bizetiae]